MNEADINSQGDKEEQEIELVAIEAIYSEDYFNHFSKIEEQDIRLKLKLKSNQTHIRSIFKISILLAEEKYIYLFVGLPIDYPSISLPFYYLEPSWIEDLGDINGIPSYIIKDIDNQLNSLFIPGFPILFEWISYLREKLIDHYDNISNLISNLSLNNTNSQPQSSFSSIVDSEEENSDIDVEDLEDNKNIKISYYDEGDNEEFDSNKNKYLNQDNDTDRMVGFPGLSHSEPLIEKKSVFVAHVAPVNSIEDVKRVQEVILLDKKVKRATHNIMAYRIVTPDGVVKASCDDDGETAAGGRLLHLLGLTDCKNVIVVVTRWYGGVQLGPARFKCINNVARKQLEKSGFIVRLPDKPPNSKRLKIPRKKR